MDARVQIFDPAVQVCFVVLPRQSVRAGCGLSLEFVERRPKRAAERVEERRPVEGMASSNACSGTRAVSGSAAPLARAIDTMTRQRGRL
jgi:hypothetical protein